jgi:hypothetical protein
MNDSFFDKEDKIIFDKMRSLSQSKQDFMNINPEDIIKVRHSYNNLTFSQCLSLEIDENGKLLSSTVHTQYLNIAFLGMYPYRVFLNQKGENNKIGQEFLKALNIFLGNII